MTYCTRKQARDAGAMGTDAQVDQAIAMAQGVVESFTGELFEPRTMTVAVDVGTDGRGFLPHRVDPGTVTATNATGTPYPAGSFRVTSSVVSGDLDTIGVGSVWGATNILIAGMEPWAARSPHRGRVLVTATFGHATVPPDVQVATALLAAGQSRFLGGTGGDGSTADQADPEGNVIPVVPPFTDTDDGGGFDPVAAGRTTGDRRADALLVKYQRTRLFTAV